MRRAPRPTPNATDGPRAVLAILLLVFVVAASLSDGKILPDFIAGRTAPPIAAMESDDDEIRTGSIFITPPDGNICEHRLIDNETWRIRPNGRVVCDEAVSWTARQLERNSSQSRIEAIREGFNHKR